MKTLFDKNRDWAAGVLERDPAFFQRLSGQQTPRYFWIGCADSRVPANVVAGLDPGEVFVQRNVANVVHSGDMNLLSTLEYAVDVLKVAHVIVCGHYGCGGVKAATEPYPQGLADHWLQPIRRLAALHAEELERAETEEDRLNRLAELNVIEGVGKVVETPIMRRAWARGQDVSVHGIIYGLKDGRLRDLGVTVHGPGPVEAVPEA
ncbi:MAG: carbonic anhydrase [Pseudomonadota bacterium]